MAHIDHMRILDISGALTLYETIEPYNYSFAVFGGTDLQKTATAITNITNFCGNTGVIVLHKNSAFEQQLNSIRTLNPSLNNLPNFEIIYANRAVSYDHREIVYDPLYGLSLEDVLDLLAPAPDNASHDSNQKSYLRSLITDYLNIMNYQFHQDNTLYGDYAFNLDLLLKLTSMPYEELQNQVLNYFPDDLRIAPYAPEIPLRYIMSRLSADKATSTAYDAVSSFSHKLENSLWTPRDFRYHSRTSIISAVKNRKVISIYVSSPHVLDYVYAELAHLNKFEVPYLLVAAEVDLCRSEGIKSLFLSEHNRQAYYTGLVAESTSCIIDNSSNRQEFSSLFSQTQKMYVFRIPDNYTATPFSEALATYQREVTDYSSGEHIRPLHLLYDYNNGTQIHEATERIVKPEELMNLGDGCLLCGKDYPLPVLTYTLLI